MPIPGCAACGGSRYQRVSAIAAACIIWVQEQTVAQTAHEGCSCGPTGTPRWHPTNLAGPQALGAEWPRDLLLLTLPSPPSARPESPPRACHTLPPARSPAPIESLPDALLGQIFAAAGRQAGVGAWGGVAG